MRKTRFLRFSTFSLYIISFQILGKYIEAEIAKNRLEELKLHEENRKRVNIVHITDNIHNNYLKNIGVNEIPSSC